MKIKRIGPSRWLLEIDDIKTELPSKSLCMEELKRYTCRQKEKFEDKERFSKWLQKQETVKHGIS